MVRRALWLTVLATAALPAARVAAQPPMRSAFFGIDNGLPVMAAVLCPLAPILDGMPLVFTEEIDQRTLGAGDFTVQTRAGRRLQPLCATTAPANQESEDRTVLLIGELGSAGADPPVRAEVTGSLRAESGAELHGAGAAVTPLEAGPSLVFAEIAHPEPDGFTVPPGTLPILPLLQTATRCPAGTAQTVRATWDGGTSAPGGGELGDAQRRAYAVTLADGTAATPFALADLGDHDNNDLLCLHETAPAVAVAMAAGTVQDPRGDRNAATAVTIE
jgi:hypothetical protein